MSKHNHRTNKTIMGGSGTLRSGSFTISFSQPLGSSSPPEGDPGTNIDEINDKTAPQWNKISGISSVEEAYESKPLRLQLTAQNVEQLPSSKMSKDAYAPQGSSAESYPTRHNTQNGYEKTQVSESDMSSTCWWNRKSIELPSINGRNKSIYECNS